MPCFAPPPLRAELPHQPVSARPGRDCSRVCSGARSGRPLPAASTAIPRAAARGQLPPKGKLLPLQTTPRAGSPGPRQLSSEREPRTRAKGLTMGLFASSLSAKDAPDRAEGDSWSWDEREEREKKKKNKNGKWSKNRQPGGNSKPLWPGGGRVRQEEVKEPRPFYYYPQRCQEPPCYGSGAQHAGKHTSARPKPT